jgi:8-oxo-dGTP pyrophosphatase MutT (NUDIX family)
MPKRDYYDDPGAPKANTIVPAVTAIVINNSNELLMIERSDNGYWAVPGGAQDIGESVIDAVKREVAEETGIVVEVVHLTGIYSDPRHVIAYDNGEVRQEFSLCFRAKPVGGSLRMSAEATKVQWVSPEQLDSLKIHPSMRLRIDHGLAAQCAPYIS